MGPRGNAAASTAEQPPAKRPREAPRQAKAEDLEEGTHVLYWGGHQGVIRDAYIPLDEFWITDAETGQIVKDEFGQIVQFSSAQLELAPSEEVPSLPEGLTRSSVLVIGREEHMMKVLEHFGEPDTKERHNPQQLLAFPCHMCGDLSTVSDGVTEELVTLARRFRPDIHVGVRSLQIKQAVDRLGASFLRLEDYYALLAVQLPYSLDAIADQGVTADERHRRKNVDNQIDFCPTASVEHPSTERPQAAARMALGQTCGIEISDLLWEEKVQRGLRQQLGVEQLALQVEGPAGGSLSILLLPEDAVATKIHGVLCFSEAAGADYEGDKKAALPSAAAAPSTQAGGGEAMLQGKTVRQWEAEQAEYAHLPKLPLGWLRVRSRKTGDIYFFNQKTQEGTFDFPEGAAPMPPNWTRQVSKSTGKSYYFNAATRTSTFDRPTA